MKNLQEEPVGENIVQLMFEHLSLIWFLMCPDRTRKQLLREVVRGFIELKKAVMKQIDDRQTAEVFFFYTTND